MNFLVQFIRFRRGAPEAIRTLSFAAVDAPSALAEAKRFIGMRSYPVRTEGLRVMDDGGRILIDWTVPVASEQPTTYVSEPVIRAAHRPEQAPLLPVQNFEVSATALTTQRHQFVAGQPVSYTEDGKPNIAKGGFEIVGLCDPGTHEPNYLIRSVEESSNRLAQEHELQEDLGARTRGR